MPAKHEELNKLKTGVAKKDIQKVESLFYVCPRFTLPKTGRIMIISRNSQKFIVGVGFLAGLMKTWPLPLEPNLLASIDIYSMYIAGAQTNISDVLGSVDIACAIGPYDSYRDLRFSKFLTEKQIAAAEEALEKRKEVSLGDDQFFAVGFRREAVVSVYISNFFSNFQSLDKESSTALSCVSGRGFLSPEKANTVIAIKLKEGI